MTSNQGQVGFCTPSLYAITKSSYITSDDENNVRDPVTCLVDSSLISPNSMATSAKDTDVCC